MLSAPKCSQVLPSVVNAFTLRPMCQQSNQPSNQQKIYLNTGNYRVIFIKSVLFYFLGRSSMDTKKITTAQKSVNKNVSGDEVQGTYTKQNIFLWRPSLGGGGLVLWWPGLPGAYWSPCFSARWAAASSSVANRSPQSPTWRRRLHYTADQQQAINSVIDQF